MTSTDLIFRELTVNVGGVDYEVACEIQGECVTGRDSYEHFGFCGSYESAEIAAELESIEVEGVEDKAIIKAVTDKVEDMIANGDFDDAFNFDN